jgi:23S rRNA pseudouridine2605 synthase
LSKINKVEKASGKNRRSNHKEDRKRKEHNKKVAFKGKKDKNSFKDKWGSKGKEGSKEKKRPSNPKTKSEDIRLNRYIASAGICSRREADDLIKAGIVKVNGDVIVEMGYKVKPGDVVNYAGQTLKQARHVYVLLNKPKDFITTRSDPQDRRTVMNLVAKATKELTYPVGRLDRMTTGLLLFTNDGDLTRKLTHPSSGIEKIYHVVTDKAVKYDHLKQMEEGIELEDGMVKADKVKYVGNGEDKKQIGVELHSGRNRIVRRMFEHFGYKVIKLDRVVFAGLTKKDLPRGKYRILTEMEVGNLKSL